MKWLLRLVVVVIIGAVLMFCDHIDAIKYAVEKGMQFSLGVPVSIDTITFDLQSRAMNITGFNLHNPKGFPEGRMLYAPETEIVLAEPVFYKKRLHVNTVTTDIDQVVVVKGVDGNMNVDSLKFFDDPANIPQIGDLEHFDKNKRVHIDTLVMSVERVVYIELTDKDAPVTRVFDVKIHNKVYKDIPGFEVMVLFILKQAMAQTAIKGAIILGAAAVSTAAFWPATLGVVLLSKDSARVDLEASRGEVYEASIRAIKKMGGKVVSGDADNGTIHASYHGNTVNLKIKDTDGGTEVVASSRKLLIPTRLTAQKILYRISEELPDR